MPILVDCPHCSTRVLPLPGRACPACRRNVDAPPDPAARSDRAVEAAVDAVQAKIRAGADPLKVARALAQQGLDRVDTDRVIARLEESRAQSVRNAGRQEMMIGGISCLIGLVITLGTARASSSLGGGSFVVAWGAILFGGYQFLRGFFRSTEGAG